MLVAGRVGEVLGGYFRRRIIIYLFVAIIFVMGTGFGMQAVRDVDHSDRAELSEYIHGFFTPASPVTGNGLSREELARRSALDYVVKTAGLMWLLGLSVIGAPLVLGVIFLRGFVLGFTITFLVEEMVLRGVVLALASVVPHNLLAVPGILLAGAAALTFSLSALRVLTGRRNINMYHQFLGCTFLTVAAAGLLVLAAFVEAYITPVLTDVVAGYLL